MTSNMNLWVKHPEFGGGPKEVIWTECELSWTELMSHCEAPREAQHLEGRLQLQWITTAGYALKTRLLFQPQAEIDRTHRHLREDRKTLSELQHTHVLVYFLCQVCWGGLTLLSQVSHTAACFHSTLDGHPVHHTHTYRRYILLLW